MNTTEYISSGIVESYVLGLASDEEQREFEQMCEKHPEVLAARIAFEIDLEKHAMENAVVLPASVRQEIKNTVLPAGTAKVLTMRTETPKTFWFKYAIAASIVLLAGSIYWNIILFNKNSQLQNNYNNTEARLSDIEKEIAIIRQNPNMKMAAMKGMPESPASFATVFWDTTSKDVYLVVNNLPKPASDKQYQLWALFNGQPIDIGMIDNNFFIGQDKLLLRMKNARNAEAFAITLEKKGGNPTPEGPMYVMGNL